MLLAGAAALGLLGAGDPSAAQARRGGAGPAPASTPAPASAPAPDAVGDPLIRWLLDLIQDYEMRPRREAVPDFVGRIATVVRDHPQFQSQDQTADAAKQAAQPRSLGRALAPVAHGAHQLAVLEHARHGLRAVLEVAPLEGVGAQRREGAHEAAVAQPARDAAQQLADAHKAPQLGHDGAKLADAQRSELRGHVSLPVRAGLGVRAQSREGAH